MPAAHKITVLISAIIALGGLAVNPALAHRFSVTLVVPTSGELQVQGQQMLEGFLLATEERDSHPNQESNGHLGGLDVYVSVIDAGGEVATEITARISRDDVDIVGYLGAINERIAITPILEELDIPLVYANPEIFLDPDQQSLQAFAKVYQSTYGSQPSPFSTQGYEIARRIDEAVRASGGVSDANALSTSFANTVRDFKW